MDKEVYFCGTIIPKWYLYNLENENMETNLIKTKLRFVVSRETGKKVAFVSTSGSGKHLRGVAESEDMPKKVCVVGHEVSEIIVPGVLYDVEMTRMKNKKGYVVLKAVPCQYEAKIESCTSPQALYQVIVSFGNREIVFDPFRGRKPSMRTIEGVIGLLSQRKDIKDLPEVIEEFSRSANAILTIYNEQIRNYGRKHRITA